ncbi:PREDICTED: carboxypeptidase B2 [Propithecus coquereli]|uniref:carboxypeptidase B2 n=1 Tax=Propithecus coquereli TaxID=379532 RepID=UPI00063F8546|nr:PREDICTED: carboxypeptidase B2 [Propithecus coquereli]
MKLCSFGVLIAIVLICEQHVFAFQRLVIVLWRPVTAELIEKKTEVHFFVNASDVSTVKAHLKMNSILFSLQMKNMQSGENSAGISAPGVSPHLPRKAAHPIHTHVSGKEQNAKNAIWIDCGIHAREWISPAFCLWFVDKVIYLYGVDETYANLLKNVNFYVMPLVNVDGYDYSWKKITEEGASSFSCSQTYCGLYPESEPEAKAVANFLRRNVDHIKAYISMHSYSQKILFPYSYSRSKSKDHEELEVIYAEEVEMVKEIGEKVISGERNTVTEKSVGVGGQMPNKVNENHLA